jgi:hypothetical protein
MALEDVQWNLGIEPVWSLNSGGDFGGTSLVRREWVRRAAGAKGFRGGRVTSGISVGAVAGPGVDGKVPGCDAGTEVLERGVAAARLPPRAELASVGALVDDRTGSTASRPAGYGGEPVDLGGVDIMTVSVWLGHLRGRGPKWSLTCGNVVVPPGRFELPTPRFRRLL